jgi:hypothetical protein
MLYRLQRQKTISFCILHRLLIVANGFMLFKLPLKIVFKDLLATCLRKFGLHRFHLLKIQFTRMQYILVHKYIRILLIIK